MIQLQNLAVGYSKSLLLQGINASAKKGSFIALLGINGIGKSTLLKALAGFSVIKQGDVLIDGISIPSASITDRSALVSLADTERADILYMTVQSFVAMGKMRFANSFNVLPSSEVVQVQQILRDLNLQNIAHKYINEVSDGERQKAVIARAVAQDTPVVILDEPTAFLDFKNKKVVFEYLAQLADKQQKLIIASTHDIELSFSFCNAWWVIDESRKLTSCSTSEEAKYFLGF